MKADSASHLIRHPIKFEAFLFIYLVFALLLQKVNIYKSNFHLIDINLVLLTIVILCRRLAWCAFQTLQFRWRINDSSKSIGTKRLVVFVCALLVLVLSVIQLIQKTSVFNLLFLFYPLLLYLSLFGFTLEPRPYRERFDPPKKFLYHLNLAGRPRDLPPLELSHDGGQANHILEYSTLLPASPDEIRSEVDTLVADLMVRLKQLLFNSLLSAYYVGFIPMLFADNHLYYDKWWCVEHTIFVWANSFVILSSHLLPPSYCQILHRCAIHLGCWARCPHNEKAEIWSPNKVWLRDAIVQWNGESFKAEGLHNVAIPCDSSQECFYLVFNSRLQIHSWLLAMQCVLVAFEIVVLLRSFFWFQIMNMSVFLSFNYFILYRLLYNRLLYRKVTWLT